jgi:arsenate reductase
MGQVTIYHNPNCSKSRQTLTLLQEKGLEPKIVLYLESPPDKPTLQNLLKMLDMPVRDIIRKSEKAYAEQDLSSESLDDDFLLDAIIRTPRLLQRPIVVHGAKAVIGRPPENVLSIL